MPVFVFAFSNIKSFLITIKGCRWNIPFPSECDYSCNFLSKERAR